MNLLFAIKQYLGTRIFNTMLINPKYSKKTEIYTLIKITFAPKMMKTFVQRLIQYYKAVFQISYRKKKVNK